MTMSRSDRADEGTDEWDAIEDDGVLDASDTLDDDRVADPLDTGVVAADRWAGANRFGTTVAEQRAGESLDQRLAEEEPDVDPYAEEPDDEDELTRRGYEPQPRAGRLVTDEQADEVAQDVGVDAGGASAEEAAVHLIDDDDEPDGAGAGPLR
jgi:Family of unknown function (DUF5709)